VVGVTAQTDFFFGNERRAIFSPCGRYRYTLYRQWREGTGRCVFVLLNPSTADEQQDDPTIRRCIGYARRWGFAELVVVNLFAWRSTDPTVLAILDDPVGPDNDKWIDDSIRMADRVVVGWGNRGKLRGRGRAVLDRLQATLKFPVCFRLTDEGQPVHPLYQLLDAVPVEVHQVEREAAVTALAKRA